MIQLKSPREIEVMAAGGRILAATHRHIQPAIAPGISTGELDAMVEAFIRGQGAVPSFKGLYGFPASACISINDEIVHGVPSDKRRLAEGDLVKLDVTAELAGYMADACITVGVGRVSEAAKRLMAAAESAFKKGLREMRDGRRALDVGRVVEDEVTRRGFSVVRELQGHGIGHTIHEEPMIPNWADPEAAEWLCEGMVLTLEPIIAAGDGAMYEDDDGWTLRTQDGSLAAHHEHTMILTRGAPLLVTA